jgi:1-acyl-sn-glycerol-3-phosphate acyltransferase
MGLTFRRPEGGKQFRFLTHPTAVTVRKAGNLGRIPNVTTLIPRPDRAAIEAQVLAITRELLRELGNSEAGEAVKGSASLERDLGLGSIERLELTSRLERTLGTSLPEGAIAEAKTLDDIIAIVAGPIDGGSLPERAPTVSLGDSERNTGAAESVSAQTSSEVRAQNPVGAQATHEHAHLFWRIGERIYGIYAGSMFSVWLAITWLILLLTPRGQKAARMTSAALRLYFRLIGCRIHMEGEEHVDAYGACIYVSNHTSYFDVPAVMALFKTDYHFLAKNEINDMPFVGTFLRKLGHFAFERRKLRARSRQAEQMEKALLRGESLFVFAEGTFTAQPGVRPFQLGAFRAAVRTGRPIVPVALRGIRRFLRDGTLLPKPARISVIVCPALFSSPDSAGREWAEVLRLRDETRRIISSHSGEPLLHTPAYDDQSEG